MTQKIIELKQAPVVLLELTEKESIGKLELKWDSPLMGGNHKVHLLNNRRHIGAVGLANHFNEDSILGILSDLTEEQFEDLEFLKMPHDVDYGGDWFIHFPFNGDHVEEYAAGAFYSLLKSENVYFENPYEHLKAGMTFAEEHENRWQEAQSRTIDPKRTVILIKTQN